LAERLVLLASSVPACRVAVSGGSTPRALFRLLANEFRASVDWSRVTLFQVDERCVPPDHDESNWRTLRTELLDRVPQVTAHRMATERADAAETYEALLRAEVPAGPGGMPRLDAVLLGMGDDGHTASLFPGSDALAETSRLVVKTQAPHPVAERLTMTLPLLNAAANRWFLVRGASKARAFQEVRAGNLPAARIEAPAWFLDPSAAG
jgi:6-phosphogluconolactonase